MSKDIKNALEHCIEWNCVDCPNREELGSGETVCRGRLLPDVLEYAANLEAKLAESEKNYKDTRELGIEQFHSLKEIINSSQEEIDKLKQQLEEKQKEIEDLKAQRRIYLNRSVEECNKITDLEFELQHKDQDKILFTLEQLEKVKKFFLEEHRDEEMDTDYIITKDAGEIADYLLDQIKKFKEMK